MYRGLGMCYNEDFSRLLKAYLEKFSLSTDSILQFECLRVESLVIADQHAVVNSTLALYTPPVTLWESVCLKLLNLRYFVLLRHVSSKVTYGSPLTGVKS